MNRIRHRIMVWTIALTLTAVGSAQAFAQPGPLTGPSSSPGGGQTPQPNRVVFTNESLPRMLKQLGYNVTEKTSANGACWQVVTQSENWTFTVHVLPVVHQGQITSILLTSDLGRKISPQAGAQDVLKVMQWNQEQAFLFYFGYNAQSGCIAAQRPYMFPDASVEEMRLLFDDFFKSVRDTHPLWNSLGAAAPAVNGTPVVSNPPAPAQSNIAGSTWTGTENLPGFGKLSFVFRPNGAATMIDTRAQTEGTWTQKGNEVTVHFKGCVYQGVIAGQTFTGTGRITEGAQAGQIWSFQVNLQKA